jgi:hypothetical protein
MTLLDMQLRASSEFALIQMPTSSPPIALIIPATVAAALLPDPNLSVLQLLEFPLSPASTINLTKLNLCPSTYFSSDQPNVDDLQTIKMIPVPHVDIIDVLLIHAAVLSPQAESTNSIQCAHIVNMPVTTPYCRPLWSITYWAEASHLRNTVCQPWMAAERVLQSQTRFRKGANGNDHTRSLVHKSYMMLGMLP